MDKIPTVPVPDDFEQGVFTRSILASLPTAPVPDGFEKSVLRRAQSNSAAKWSAIGGGMLLLILTVLVWYNAMQPDVIRVAYVPNIEQRSVDLENLRPAPVFEYTNAEQPSAAQHGRPAARKLIGVAGYPR